MRPAPLRRPTVDAKPPAMMSRRRFMQGSLIAVSGLAIVGYEGRSPAAANNVPKQPPTTLSGVLEVSTFYVFGAGRPANVVDYARAHKISVDELLTSAGGTYAADVASNLQILDATWPHTLLLGNLPPERREAALRYAAGLAPDRPSLGTDRTFQPVEKSDKTSTDRRRRDQSWTASAMSILTTSLAALDAITQPHDQPPVDDPPEAAEPDVTTLEP